MINGKKVVVVLPAYNAAATLERTFRDIDKSIVDDVLLVDDRSDDDTVSVSQSLGISTYIHVENRGYGANQKTCYREALRLNADVVVMLHPDYQYDPRLIPSIAGMISSGGYDAAIGSRFLTQSPLKGGMPFYKFLSNKVLTWIQNRFLGIQLSEYHTGYRAFSREVLETIPFMQNSDDFIFDNQMMVQLRQFGFSIGEISCPAKYFPEASSINLRRSIKYGLGVLMVSGQYALQNLQLGRFAFLSKKGGGKAVETPAIGVTQLLK